MVRCLKLQLSLEGERLRETMSRYGALYSDLSILDSGENFLEGKTFAQTSLMLREPNIIVWFSFASREMEPWIKAD